MTTWSLRTTTWSLRTTTWSLRTGGHFKKVVVKKDLTVIIQDLFAEYG